MDVQAFSADVVSLMSDSWMAMMQPITTFLIALS